MKHNRGKFWRFVKITIGIALLLFIVTIGFYEMQPKELTQEQTESMTDAELDAIMKEEKFSKETLIRAKTVKLTREREREVNRHNAVIATENTLHGQNLKTIDDALDTVRNEQLQMAGKTDSLN